MAHFLETYYLESSPREVDEAGGWLRHAKLLGMESRNNRKYTKESMKEAAPKYNGLKIYIDHPKRSEVSEGADRSMKDWAGTIHNAKFESDGVYGDIKLRKKSQHFDGIIEAARDFPKDVGFSHVADGASKYEGETEIVESYKPYSVDLVADPATTAGFFESVKPAKKNTVKHAVESLPESPIRKRLIEMMDGGFMDGSMAVEPDDVPADPLSQANALLMQLVTVLGDALKTSVGKPAPAPVVTPPPAPDAPEEDMEQDPKKPAKPDVADEAMAFESLKRENAELKAGKLLLESGREATPARIKALASAAEADQKELLESWPQLEAGERPQRSPALIESEDIDLTPSDPKRYAASLR